MTYMDWVYQPEDRGDDRRVHQLHHPGRGRPGVIEKDADRRRPSDRQDVYEGLATSPLIFPTPADFARLHRYRVLTKAEQIVWNSLFEPIYQS